MSAPDLSWKIGRRVHCLDEIVQAHMFLYYFGPLMGFGTAWSDWDYDQWCKGFGVDGSGGSDCSDDYPDRVQALAAVFWFRRTELVPGLFTREMAVKLPSPSGP